MADEAAARIAKDEARLEAEKQNETAPAQDDSYGKV